MSRRWLPLLLLAAFPMLPLAAEDERPADPGATWDRSRNNDGRWNQTDVGPFLASVLPTPNGTIAKGLSIKLGDDTTIAYDLATMSPRAAWTGGFLKFDPAKFGIVRAPQIDGEVQWGDAGPAWGDAMVEYVGLLTDGPSTPTKVDKPKDGKQTAKVFGARENSVPETLLHYMVNGRHVLETSGAQVTKTSAWWSRILVVGPSDEPIVLTCHPKSPGEDEDGWDIVAAVDGKAVDAESGKVTIAPNRENTVVLLAFSRGDTAAELTARELEWAGWRPQRRLFRPGEGLWTIKPKAAPDPTEGIATTGTRASDDAPYVVDTIAIPFENPTKSLMFLTGLDFLQDGTLAVCTLYGEVWLVEGIDDDLDEVTWRRFATGLHQPLGLKVVDGKVHVLGRDQITRLHDEDGNGEAEFYENVNNAGQTSTSGHDYAACLETDPDGNFYYIRAHEGVVRVSKNGSTSESIAQGFRNPVGLGVSPTGMVTAAPQEGNWTPASGIFEVKRNGWYGFAGPKVTPERPLGYDPPICWMPRLQDNSSGGQIWAPEKGFGPFSGMMLHFSYGQCAMLAVPFERVDGVAQGATVRLPMFFDSGVMRGRFGPDGHLYVCGLRGWQTSAAKDGCLQRVRYTGKPAHLPVEFHVKPTGVELVFSAPLERTSAGDPQNWAVEQWNYRYSKEYGSKDYLVTEPRKTGRDEVFLEDVEVSEDGRTVRLVFEEDVEPVMQMGITYDVNAADGSRLRDVIYGTVNKVPAQ